MQRLGPVQPKWIEITPAVAFGIIIGTKNGLTRLAPCSRNVCSLISSVSSPPTPVAAITAHAARVGAELAGVGERVGGGARSRAA